MRTMHISNLRRAALGAVGAGALIVTAACGASDGARLRAMGYDGGLAQPVSQQTAAAPNGQVLVNCEPNQRTLVRQTFVNGQPVAQVQCVAAEPAAYDAAYGNGAYPVAYGNGVIAPRDYGYDTRVVQPAVVQQPVVYRPARTVTQRRVVTERVDRGRSVKKSAIIIGSSAGVGAGVGAAVGGKKGALIGAAIGGGSAAIWDQITRH